MIEKQNPSWNFRSMQIQRPSAVSPYWISFITACSAILVLWYVVPPIFGIAVDISRNYNEGWMVNSAQRLLLGLPLYPDTDVLVVNNYPPLWYLLLATAQLIGFDMNASGRVVELLSLGGCGVFVYLIACQLFASKIAALSAAAVFLAVAVSWLPGYVGINDPHLLGQCLMLCGIWIALRSKSTGSLALSALTCCIAGFTKHSLIPLPLGLSLYFLITDRRSFAIYTGALVAIGIAGLGICSAIWGADFWNGILSVATYDRWKLQLHIEERWYYYVSAILALYVGIRRCRADVRLLWLPVYLVISLGFGMLYQSATGTSGNHFLDSLVAISLILAVSATPTSDGARTQAYVMLAATALLLIGNAIWSWNVPLDRFAARDERNEAEREMAATLRSIEGKVACEDAMLCAEAGKLSELDFFNIGQRLARGRLTSQEFLNILESRDVMAVQFSRVPGSSHRLVPKDVDAVLAMYPKSVLANSHFTLRARESATKTGPSLGGQL